MQIDDKTEKLLKYVQSLFNVPVYLVGGAVRDIKLGLIPKDYDFCTSMVTEKMKSDLKGKHRVYLIGEKHGTIGFKVNDEMIEITTFRTETYKAGSRQPIVEFVTDLKEDLSRRDFTINAMALHCGTFELLDPFNGQADLKIKCLRTVGNSKLRFKEDPLRILRGIRIASKYELATQDKTGKRLHSMAHKLLEISKERCMDELDKILSLEGDQLQMGLWRLWYYDVFRYLMPELHMQFKFNQNSPYHDFDLHRHTMAVVRSIPNDLNMRWAALLHDVGKPFVARRNKKGHDNYMTHEILGEDIVKKYALHLKWSKERRLTVASLVRNHLDKDSPLKPYDDANKLESAT